MPTASFIVTSSPQIFLSPAERHAKILDFGIAKIPVAGSQSDNSGLTMSRDHLASSGSALGSAAYMSPEQARGKDLDARGDIFPAGPRLTNDQS